MDWRKAIQFTIRRWIDSHFRSNDDPMSGDRLQRCAVLQTKPRRAASNGSAAAIANQQRDCVASVAFREALSEQRGVVGIPSH